MDFLQRNLFVKLRSDHFHTKEEMEPMTTFKRKKIAQMMKNLSDVPAGEVRMNNGFLNRRLASIQENERHAIDTSIETIHLLRIIVSNINGILANGVNLGGIIEMGNYLRTKGDKIPFVRRVERGAYKLTLRSLYYNSLDQQEILFEQTQAGFVRTTGGTMRKNLRRSMRYLEYAPIETISNFCNNFYRSLSEIEE